MLTPHPYAPILERAAVWGPAGAWVGAGSFASQQSSPQPQAHTPQELKALREESRNLKNQLERIEKRIAQMTQEKGG